jgi:peptidyl-prolyl cis-trans isomerase D
MDAIASCWRPGHEPGNVRSQRTHQPVEPAGAGGCRRQRLCPNSAADIALNAYFEKREIQLARFNAADFAAKLNPTDADLEQFYKANEKLFQAPEQASIEYVTAGHGQRQKDLLSTRPTSRPTTSRMSSALKEERRASHILIASPKSASAADREKARAKAQELLALVKKSPDTFADVARKNSQDPGSAPGRGPRFLRARLHGQAF